jgi:hypothetical protein
MTEPKGTKHCGMCGRPLAEGELPLCHKICFLVSGQMQSYARPNPECGSQWRQEREASADPGEHYTFSLKIEATP